MFIPLHNLSLSLSLTHTQTHVHMHIHWAPHHRLTSSLFHKWLTRSGIWNSAVYSSFLSLEFASKDIFFMFHSKTQWIILLNCLLMWYSLMKVKSPGLCCWHLINYHEIAPRKRSHLRYFISVDGGEGKKYLFHLQIINKGWLSVHPLLGNLLFSKLLAVSGTDK